MEYFQVLRRRVVLEDMLHFFQKHWRNTRTTELITQRPGWCSTKRGITLVDIEITSCYEASKKS